jgi:hypothetical protein
VTSKKPTTAAKKAERERDQAQALREYEAEKRAVHANMKRPRALRLAKETAHWQVDREDGVLAVKTSAA